MKNILSKTLIAFALTIGLSTSCFAYYHHYHNSGYGSSWHHGYYYHNRNYYQHNGWWNGGGPAVIITTSGYRQTGYSCGWIPGHYNSHGYWKPAHKVCN